MAGFRRAQLRGSDELFRPTAQGEDPRSQESTSHFSDETRLNGNSSHDTAPTPEKLPQSPKEASPIPEVAVPAPSGSIGVTFSPREIEILADAVQRMKFPNKIAARPSVDEFERLEELRQRLLDLLEH